MKFTIDGQFPCFSVIRARDGKTVAQFKYRHQAQRHIAALSLPFPWLEIVVALFVCGIIATVFFFL